MTEDHPVARTIGKLGRSGTISRPAGPAAAQGAIKRSAGGSLSRTGSRVLRRTRGREPNNALGASDTLGLSGGAGP